MCRASILFGTIECFFQVRQAARLFVVRNESLLQLLSMCNKLRVKLGVRDADQGIDAGLNRDASLLTITVTGTIMFAELNIFSTHIDNDETKAAVM